MTDHLDPTDPDDTVDPIVARRRALRATGAVVPLADGEELDPTDPVAQYRAMRRATGCAL